MLKSHPKLLSGSALLCAQAKLSNGRSSHIGGGQSRSHLDCDEDGEAGLRAELRSRPGALAISDRKADGPYNITGVAKHLWAFSKQDVRTRRRQQRHKTNFGLQGPSIVMSLADTRA